MTPKKDGKKVTDWLFSLYASNTFAKQIAANNKVANSVQGNDADQEDKLPPSRIQQIKDEINF